MKPLWKNISSFQRIWCTSLVTGNGIYNPDSLCRMNQRTAHLQSGGSEKLFCKLLENIYLALSCICLI